MIKYIMIFLITGLRPILGPATCRFDESCFHFAIRQFEQASFFQACWATIKRLLSCSPLNRSTLK